MRGVLSLYASLGNSTQRIMAACRIVVTSREVPGAAVVGSSFTEASSETRSALVRSLVHSSLSKRTTSPTAYESPSGGGTSSRVESQLLAAVPSAGGMWHHGLT